jgi:TnpA family transposase
LGDEPFQWLRDQELRLRSHVGLDKDEQQNALSRAVFFNRLGDPLRISAIAPAV